MLQDTDRGHLSSAYINIYEHSCDLLRPSTLYKPRLFVDGDHWCALYGDDLQNGVAGFGKSPDLAYKDFDRNWLKKLDKK